MAVFAGLSKDPNVKGQYVERQLQKKYRVKWAKDAGERVRYDESKNIGSAPVSISTL